MRWYFVGSVLCFLLDNLRCLLFGLRCVALNCHRESGIDLRTQRKRPNPALQIFVRCTLLGKNPISLRKQWRQVTFQCHPPEQIAYKSSSKQDVTSRLIFCLPKSLAAAPRPLDECSLGMGGCPNQSQLRRKSSLHLSNNSLYLNDHKQQLYTFTLFLETLVYASQDVLSRLRVQQKRHKHRHVSELCTFRLFSVR